MQILELTQWLTEMLDQMLTKTPDVLEQRQ